MSNVARYGFISAKIRGMKNRLLKTEDYNALLNRPYKELYKYLNSTAYAQYIRNINEQSTPIELEKAVIQSMFDTIQEIIKWLPKNVNTFIAKYLTKFEEENVKAAMRCKYLQLPAQKLEQYLIPIPLGLSTKEYLDAYTKAKYIKDLLQRLYLKGSIINLNKLIENNKLKSNEDLISWEIALDKSIYIEIQESADKLKGSDKKIAKENIGIEIDLCNVKNTIRGRILNIPWEEMAENLIEKTYKIPIKTLRKAFLTKDTTEALKITLAEQYREIFKQIRELARENKLTDIEIILNKYLYGYYKTLWRKPFPFNIGLIVAFLGLKWFEVKNLKAIIYGKSYGLSANEIQKSLTY